MPSIIIDIADQDLFDRICNAITVVNHHIDTDKVSKVDFAKLMITKSMMDTLLQYEVTIAKNDAETKKSTEVSDILNAPDAIVINISDELKLSQASDSEETVKATSLPA